MLKQNYSKLLKIPRLKIRLRIKNLKLKNFNYILDDKITYNIESVFQNRFNVV